MFPRTELRLSAIFLMKLVIRSKASLRLFVRLCSFSMSICWELFAASIFALSPCCQLATWSGVAFASGEERRQARSWSRIPFSLSAGILGRMERVSFIFAMSLLRAWTASIWFLSVASSRLARCDWMAIIALSRSRPLRAPRVRPPQMPLRDEPALTVFACAGAPARPTSAAACFTSGGTAITVGGAALATGLAPGATAAAIFGALIAAGAVFAAACRVSTCLTHACCSGEAALSFMHSTSFAIAASEAPAMAGSSVRAAARMGPAAWIRFIVSLWSLSCALEHAGEAGDDALDVDLAHLGKERQRSSLAADALGIGEHPFAEALRAEELREVDRLVGDADAHAVLLHRIDHRLASRARLFERQQHGEHVPAMAGIVAPRQALGREEVVALEAGEVV